MADPRNVSIGVDLKNADKVQRFLTGFIGTWEDLAQQLAKFGATVGALDKDVTFNVNLESAGKFRKEVGGLSRVTKNLTTETDKLAAANGNRLKLEEQGATVARQRLAQAKQELGALGPLSSGYKEQQEKVQKLTEEYRRAQGIMPNSVRDLEEIGRELAAQASKFTLAEQASQGYTQALDQNAAAIRAAKGVQAGSVADLQANLSKQRELASILPIGSKAQLDAARAADAYARKIQQASGKTVSFIGVLGKLSTIQSGLLAVTSAFSGINGAINKVVNRTKSIQAFELALRNVGLSATETATTFNTAAQSATNLGAPVEQVEKAYKRITPALRAIGSSASETDRFIEGLTARTQVLGLTTDESGRLQEAFAQVLSKGKLQAEELTQQISEVDGAFRTQFADALGVTIEKLGEMVESGQVTSTVFVDAFLKMENGVDALKSKVENGTATIQQLQNNISTIQTKTLEDIGKAAEPGIRAILELTRVFAEFVREALNSSWGQALINAFNSIAGTLEALGKAFVATGKAIGTVLAPLGPILELLGNFAGPIAAVIAGFAALRVVMALVNKSQKKYNELIEDGNKSAISFSKGLGSIRKAFADLLKGDVNGFFKNILNSFKELGEAGARLTTGDKIFDNLKKLINLRDKGAASGKGVDLLGGKKLAYGNAQLGKSIGVLGKVKGAVAGVKLAGVAAAAAVGAVAIAVTAAFAAAAVVFNEYKRSIDQFRKPIDESKNQLKDLGFEVENTSFAIDKFKSFLKAMLGPLGLVIDGVKALVSELQMFGRELAFQEAMKKNEEQLKSISTFLKGEGASSFLDYANIQKMSAKDLDKYRKGLNAVKNSLDQQASSLQKQIDKLKEAEQPNERQIKQLEDQKEEFLEKAAAIEIATDGTRGMIGLTHEAAETDGTLKERLEASNKALETRKQKLEQVAAAIDVEGQKELNAGLITENQLILRNAAVRQQVAASNLAAIQAEIRLNSQRTAERNQDVVALRNQARELGRAQAEAAKEAEAAEAELKKAQIERIKEVKQENDQLIQSYGQLKGLQTAGFQDLTSGIQSTFDTFRQEIGRAARINFIVTGDKRFLTEALRTEKEMFKLQFEIEKVKRRVAHEEKQHKLEMIRLEQQAQVALLQSQPRTQANQERINALNEIIAKTRQMQGLNDTMFEAEEYANNLNYRALQNNLNVRLKAAGLPLLKLYDLKNLKAPSTEIPRITKNLAGQAQAVGKGIITINGQTVKIAQKGLQDIGRAGTESKTAMNGAVGALETGINKMTTEGRKINENFFGLDPSKVNASLGEVRGQFSSAMRGMAGEVSQLNTQLNGTSTQLKNIGTDAANSMSSLSQALQATTSLRDAVAGLPDLNRRATGGPVAGGSTYTINDGGGRESFLDSTGKVSLLPAARNMKWTAPKSGYVLNADDTKTLINNGKINASINAATKTSKPSKVSQTVSGIVPSGTLIKQMGSMMKGGETQRITNNVTIQSQQPIMDASKLLTDINIMRARRRGRL